MLQGALQRHHISLWYADYIKGNITMTHLYLGGNNSQQHITLRYANRHGIIAGATGTGKTVTLQGMAEAFSMAGVPVFIADIKGDISGMARAGEEKPAFKKRADDLGITPSYRPFPVIFWDVYGEQGHPVRTTMSEMGPVLLARLLELNDTQTGVLQVVFAVADAEGLLLIDMDDLRAMLLHLSENASTYSARYGNVSAASVAAIQRSLLTLEQAGGKHFFGEPALEVSEFIRLAPNGEGAVNILAADKLMQSPKLYATFMLWMLSELFEELPEIGDVEKPKLVFFFDEAHLLFDDAPKALVDKIEQLVRLIRSKGVGVYFVTQNPADVPDAILGQLAHRIQHALRAYTPADQKMLKAAAQSFRANAAFDTEEVITQLAVGEALVSVLEEGGVPSVVQRCLMRPVSSRVGAITSQERAEMLKMSPIAGVYEEALNRESASEMLQTRMQQPRTESDNLWGTSARAPLPKPPSKAKAAPRPTASLGEQIAKQVIREVGTTVTKQLVRGILGALLKR